LWQGKEGGLVRQAGGHKEDSDVYGHANASLTQAQPRELDLLTFKLLLNLLSYFKSTHGKLIKHFTGPTTLERTIGRDRGLSHA
jgi:hypothetical protein